MNRLRLPSPCSPCSPWLTLVRTSTSLLTAALLLALSASPALAQPQQPSPAQAEFDRLIAQALAARSPALAAVPIAQLNALRSFVSTAHAARELERAAAATPHPQARVLLERQLEYARRELGDTSGGPGGMRGPIGQHGCMTQFSLVGPFANDSMEGFHGALPPQAGEAGPYTGKLGEIDWRTLPDFTNQCALNLDVSVEPNSDGVVFLAARLTTARATPARLLLGASGSYQVWLNGAPVALREEDAGFAIDTDAWELPLKKGSNQLVIKLASSEGRAFDMMVRLVGRDLKPLGGVEAQPAWDGAPLRDIKSVTLKQAPGGMAQAARALTTGGTPGVETLAAAWLWSAVERRNAATPWRDVAESIDEAVSAERLTLTGAQHIMLASLFEEHWRRVTLMERAHAAYPDDPWVTFALAEEYERGGTQQRSDQRRALLERLVATQPDMLPALLELAGWWRQHHAPLKGLALLEAHKTPAHLRTSAYTLALISALSGLERDEEAMVLRRALHTTHALSANLTWYELHAAQIKREHSAALALVRAERARAPWSRAWLMREVDLLRLSGDWEGAMAALNARLEEVPGEFETLNKAANLWVARGDAERAAATLEAALITRPQDQSLRDHISYLRPGSDRYHERWMRDDLRELSAQVEAGPYHSSMLLDQTILRVSPNGLDQRVVQRAERINTPQGKDSASVSRISYQSGDERVDILRVRVLKADGSISEDYDTWVSEGSRKGGSTYNDSSTVTLRANNAEPGDIIEVRYRLSKVASRNFRGDYFGDIEYVQGNRPIGAYRYAVIYPDSFGSLHFRPPRLPHARTDNAAPDGSAIERGYRATSFEIQGVPDVKTDPDQPGYTDVYDYILVSNKKTYDEVGLWWWNLIKEQLIVDEPIRRKVVELTRGLKTDDEKLRAIHNYVVQNTRYLHVGLGIHGWKPYRTTTCFRNRFGDCKDKAALLKVMLEEAGIPTQMVLVRTRQLGSVSADPASMHIFNHAIAYVPGMDLFLDGTAEFNGTRELTTMDQGAQALIVEDGGKTRWVTLPIDSPDVNTLRQELVVDLSTTPPTATLTLVAQGANAVYYRTVLEDAERRDEVMEKQLATTFPGASLTRATYSDLKKLEQPVTIALTFSGGQLMRESESRRFLYPLGAPKDLLGSYASQASRDQDLSIRVPFTNQTTVRYRLPGNTSATKIPQGKVLKSAFGSLEVEYTQDAEGIVAEVRYSIDVQRVKASEYKEFRGFMRDITGALNETIELE